MSGVATSLDFASVMAIGAAHGVDLELLADVLPDIETALLAGLAGDDDGE